MSFERFISTRYLFSKHKINFISIISFISITGITLGVAALIVVLSVFNGFGDLVTSFLMNYDPHIRVEFKTEDHSISDNELREILQSTPDLKALAPFVSGKVLIKRQNKIEVTSLKGIETKEIDNVYNIRESILFGNAELPKDEGLPGIIIGIKLADNLQSIIGDTLTLISPAGIESAIARFSLPKTKEFIVTGIFSSQNNEYDASLVFTALPEAQSLLGYGNSFQGYEIKLNSSDKSFDAKNYLISKLDNKIFSVNTWYDFHRELYNMMQIERWVAYVLLSLIIAVASFNILGSLSMSVIEKKRDIGILRSMGAKEKSILKIFMFEGIMIGIAGTIIGLIIGYFVCYLQINYNIYPLDPTQYKIAALPVKLKLSDFFVVSGASLLLSFFASLIPAKRAAKVDALQAIKWE